MNILRLIENSFWHTNGSYDQNYGKSIGTGNGSFKVIDLENSTIYSRTGTVTFSKNPNDSSDVPVLDVDGSLQTNKVIIGSDTMKFNEAKNCVELANYSGKKVYLKPKSSADFPNLTASQRANCSFVVTQGDVDELENRLSVNKDNLKLLLDILKQYPEMESEVDNLNNIENLLN